MRLSIRQLDNPEGLLSSLVLPHSNSKSSESSRAREHRLPRWILDRLIAARTGHGDFAAYHERF
jgi:hypothetical protein